MSDGGGNADCFESIKVIARMRPLEANDENVNDSHCSLHIQEAGIVWSKNDTTKALNLNTVLDEAATQVNVFEQFQDLVDHVINGYDCCIMA
ncbi:hypothetical protein Ae201684P_002758 [Aphanomyces euteiches]|nr:hypothetical protein Ae201684P_002758 [Aphanomyces euteiches]